MIGFEFADAGGADGAVIGRVHGFLRFGLFADHAAETAVCEDIGLQNAGFFSLGFFFQTEAGLFLLPCQIFGTDVLVDLGRAALGTFHLAIRGSGEPLVVVESVAAQGAFVAAGGERVLCFVAAFETATGAGGILTEIVPLVTGDFA